MAQKPETTFTTSVHKHLPQSLYRMKTHNPYMGGIPDVWYSGNSDLWVEYKFEVLPKRETTLIPVTISELQAEWLNKRYSEGRNVAVIVGCKEGGVVLTDRAWNSSLNKQDFLGKLMSRQQIAKWIMDRTGGSP
jgi:hypothetical protein